MVHINFDMRTGVWRANYAILDKASGDVADMHAESSKLVVL